MEINKRINSEEFEKEIDSICSSLDREEILVPLGIRFISFSHSLETKCRENDIKNRLEKEYIQKSLENIKMMEDYWSKIRKRLTSRTGLEMKNISEEYHPREINKIICSLKADSRGYPNSSYNPVRFQIKNTFSVDNPLLEFSYWVVSNTLESNKDIHAPILKEIFEEARENKNHQIDKSIEIISRNIKNNQNYTVEDLKEIADEERTEIRLILMDIIRSGKTFSFQKLKESNVPKPRETLDYISQSQDKRYSEIERSL